MTTEESKAIARRWVEALNQENWATLIVELFPTPAAAAEFIQMHTLFRAAFSNYHFTIDDLIAEGDKVVVRGTVHATHTGEFPVGELKGLAPTGKPLAWAEVWMLPVSAPMDSWLLVDGVSRLQQLGVLPTPK